MPGHSGIVNKTVRSDEVDFFQALVKFIPFYAGNGLHFSPLKINFQFSRALINKRPVGGFSFHFFYPFRF